MPELPEVETVRAGLESLVSGTVVESVEIRRDSCVRLLAGGVPEFCALVTGERIRAVARRGKFMWFELVAPDATGAEPPREALSAHLGMSGQFRVHDTRWDQAPDPHPHCRARIFLRATNAPSGSGHLVLDFIDQRTFGYLHTEGLVSTADGAPAGAGTHHSLLPASVAHIGRDALDPNLDVEQSLARWRRGSRGIKQVILDQSIVSGIGNIYADEALWTARIHPERPAHAMSKRQASTLLVAAQSVMASALSQGGTSFDSLYVNVNGESGYFSRSLEAYGRGGEACSRCGSAIRLATVGGRSTHWCARCQRRWAPRSGPLDSGA